MPITKVVWDQRLAVSGIDSTHMFALIGTIRYTRTHTCVTAAHTQTHRHTCTCALCEHMLGTGRRWINPLVKQGTKATGRGKVFIE